MAELPEDVVRETTRLTRLAREAVDENEAAAYRRRRDQQVAEYGFLARERERDETLVLYPTEWVADGVVRTERIDDLDRGVEIPLEGSDEAASWESVEAHNAALVEAVEADHGAVHAANARAFADFMGNHRARRVETATAADVREFLEEYYPRNAWPSDEQQAVVARSLQLLFDEADASMPDYS
jgi:transcription elongation GreA/GreB family factor